MSVPATATATLRATLRAAVLPSTWLITLACAGPVAAGFGYGMPAGGAGCSADPLPIPNAPASSGLTGAAPGVKVRRAAAGIDCACSGDAATAILPPRIS